MVVATFVLNTERERGYALAAVMKARVGDKPDQVRISKPTRDKNQNARLHAVLTDIADQLYWPPPPRNDGELRNVDWWKRAGTLTWLHEIGGRPELIVSLDGKHMGLLLPHTSDLDVSECASLIEWLYAFGATNGVVFREPKREQPPIEVYDDPR